MKKILVPCDFSKTSQEAFKLACQIAAKAKGEVTVLHVIYLPAMYDPMYAGGLPLSYDPVFINGIEETARKEFDNMMDTCIDRSLKVDFEITTGEIISAINRMVELKAIDLVVMGTSGASGFEEVFIGSNTEKVVRHATVPVLAVRTAPDLASIKNILLPSTLTLNQTEFINKVKELQVFFGARLHVLVINTPSHFKQDNEAREALEEFAKHYKLNDYVLHFRNYRNEEDGIIDFAYDEDIDLIVMATHARKGLAHLFNGSITEDVVNHIQAPVWTYHLNK